MLDKEFDASGSKSRNKIHTEISPEGNYTTYISANNVSDYYQKLVKDGWIGGRDGNTKVDIVSEEFTNKYYDWNREYRRVRLLYKNREFAIRKLNRMEKENQ